MQISKITEPLSFGPEMRKLAVKEQIFVCNLFLGLRSVTKAAELAGYREDPTEPRNNLRVRAHRLLHDPRLIPAIREEAQRRTAFLIPRAQQALADILENPQHADHFKAIKTVRDDGGVTKAVEKVLNVQISITQEEKIKAIELFAKNHGINPKTLLGFDPTPTIEADFTEVKPDFDKEFE